MTAEKWNHHDLLILIHVSRTSGGGKEPRTKDWEKQVSKEWAWAGLPCTSLGGDVNPSSILLRPYMGKATWSPPV